ncbi:MAG: DUF1553 domain-containing protein [Planctomycetaceae bacterium]|nr:DUF1553 domain-containing protein [Planctomycetaceae bacterium]
MLRNLATSLALIAFIACLSSASQAADPYAELIQADAPVAWWRFSGDGEAAWQDASGNGFHGVVRGRVESAIAGPRPSEYPDFAADNTAAKFSKGPNYLVVSDSGDVSLLDFAKGDAITMEAWVQLEGPLPGGYPYIIGKGRTGNPGVTANNQNYALRLANDKAGIVLSFLFVDSETERSPKGLDQEAHRWQSTTGVPDDGAWHHVAVTFEFGKADSIKGYIDGAPVTGKWDMGGATDKQPVVDNDELWIGSSMGGGSTLGGNLDEVALYRSALSPERIKARAKINLAESKFALGKVDPALVPTDRVRVEIVERVPVARKWSFRMQEPKLLYETDVFALKKIPPKYDAAGLIVDRPVPMLLHLVSNIEFAGGEHEFILRSLDASRLYIDGELVAETGFKNLNGSAHGPYYELPDQGPEMLSIAAAHLEQRVKVTLESGRHIVSLYRLLGNKGAGQHLGEMVVGVSHAGAPFQFLAPTRELAFTDANWLQFMQEDRIRMRDWSQQERLAASEKERAYWDQRHEFARENCAIPAPVVPPGDAKSPIDRFLNHILAEAGKQPTDSIDDFAFLRRVSLDTVGTIPSTEMIESYFADPVETRRERLVDRLLNDPAWADAWVGYWQDVLAENPGLTKPELNNTGPFRWFLYEAMLDNMPLDRFVSELTLMRGSAYQGGPAGFSIATQNDVPLAAKAHILGTAFLAVEMKCARCHDAPYHDVAQGDLFGLAAMLKRGPEKVPGTSSIPGDPEAVARANVTVSLRPGDSVKPNWPFAEFVSTGDPAAQAELAREEILPTELWRFGDDSREKLAAMLTSPRNSRFPRVMANRVWQRLLGRALIEPVDDWEEAECKHPELLDYLAHELVTHNYDLKHLYRKILLSDVYQRQYANGLNRDSEDAAWFQGPIRRKVTGDQLADSLYRVTGKSFRAEELTMDGDGKQDESRFGHLGIPERSWELAAVSNERDRPSMSLPVAQSVIDLMSAYGWRQNRQDPLTLREDPLTALQPMALAHGTAPNRVIDFSDQSEFTAFALEDQPLEDFVEGLYLRLLTRSPSTEERELVVSVLQEGYADRVIAGPEAVPPVRLFRSGVTWSNHFDPKSDIEAMQRQRDILAGDPPSARLNADWRGRAEDVVWSLVNSPEFVFIP